MKKLLTILFLSLGVAAQAQTSIKINNFIIQRAFITDTATAVKIRCIWNQIDQETANQRPVFFLELVDAKGISVESRNIEYQDMINACAKNGIPENQHSGIVQSTFSAVLAGTKTQKLAAIRALMSGYGITVKPDNQQ